MSVDTFVLPVAGGMLIGLAASALLLFNGRIAGISGIVGGILGADAQDRAWRWAFLGGLVAAGLILAPVLPDAFVNPLSRSDGAIVVAGALVGVGTRLGSGCTSGHGICGLARLSRRSLVAVVGFMCAGVVSATVVNHLLGGSL